MTQQKIKTLHPAAATLIIFLSLILFLPGCGTMMTLFGHQSPQDSFLENMPQLTMKDLDNFKAGLKPINTEIKAKYLLARHFQRLNRHLNAIEELNEVIKMEPYFPEAYNALGVSYDSLGKFAMAEECYHMALRLNPDLAYVVNNLGYSYMMQGKMEAARQYLEMAVAMEETNLKYRNNLALASQGSENTGQETLQESALQSEPEQTPEKLVSSEPVATETAGVAEPAETISKDAEVVKNAPVQVAFVETVPGLNQPQEENVIETSVAEPDQVVSETIESLNTEHSGSPEPLKSDSPLETETILIASSNLNTESLNTEHSQNTEHSGPIALNPEPLNPEHSGPIALNTEPLNTEPLNTEHSQNTEHSNPEPLQLAITQKDNPDNGSRFYKFSPPSLIENQVETRNSEKEDVVITIAKVSDESVATDASDSISRNQPLNDSPVVLEIILVNGNGVNGFARKTGNYLKEKGYRIRSLQNADHFNYKETKIYFHKNLKDDARLLSEQLPGDHSISEANMIHHGETYIRILLGKDMINRAGQEYQIEISNGNGINGAAKRMSVYLRGKGFPVNRLTNADHFKYEATRIFFGKDQLSHAQALLEILPEGHQATMVQLDQDSGKIRLLIGKDVGVN